MHKLFKELLVFGVGIFCWVYYDDIKNGNLIARRGLDLDFGLFFLLQEITKNWAVTLKL